MTYQAYRRKEKRAENRFHAGVAVLLALAIIFIGGCLYGILNETDPYAYSETTTYYVVQGDTLWGIVSQYSDNRHDPRKVIYDIQQINQIGSLIHPGQKIEVPLYEILQDKPPN